MVYYVDIDQGRLIYSKCRRCDWGKTAISKTFQRSWQLDLMPYPPWRTPATHLGWCDIINEAIRLTPENEVKIEAKPVQYTEVLVSFPSTHQDGPINKQLIGLKKKQTGNCWYINKTHLKTNRGYLKLLKIGHVTSQIASLDTFLDPQLHRSKLGLSPQNPVFINHVPITIMITVALHRIAMN